MNLICRSILSLVSILLLALSSLTYAADTPGRQILNFDQGWRFCRVEGAVPTDLDGSPLAFDDRAWDVVNVPHSVRLEPWNAGGELNFRGLCWYRRHFTPEDAWKGKRIFIEFGGAMQVADVWLNDKQLTTHYGGYLPIVLDITDLVHFGSDNVISLRLDNRDQPLVPPGKPEKTLDFDYFGGLYRDVHLIVTDPLHITDPILANRRNAGIFVTFPQMTPQVATVRVDTNIANELDAAADCDVRQDLIDGEGKTVATITSPSNVAVKSSADLSQKFDVPQPHLWHPNHSYLYSLRTQILRHGVLVDDITTRIGIRTFEFRADGLFINGEKFFSVGFNHHEDYPYVGVAVPDSLEALDVMKMREAGMTSFRSHYPHSKAFMDACDQFGVLTIVSTPGWQYFTSNDTFLQRSYQDTREMVRLNRNRPSVMLWEVGLNESAYSETYARTAHAIVHEELPTGPCFTSGDARAKYQKTDPIFDVCYTDSDRKISRPLWWREFGDDKDMNWGDQVSDNRVARGYGEAAMLLQMKVHEEALKAVMGTTPTICGANLWAGIDCDRGYHPTPFLGGILDKARLPKFDASFFASQRPADVHIDGLSDGPMVAIATLMTRFSPKDVTVLSNCEQVKLFRGKRGHADELVDTKNVTNDGGVPHAPVVFANAMPDRMDHAEIKAQGLIGGKVVAEQTLDTAGVTKKLLLTIDDEGRGLLADGSDMIIVHATTTDAAKNVVTFDDQPILFSVDGPADVVGDASIGANPVRSELGIATAFIRSRPTAGHIRIRASSRTLGSTEFELDSHPMTEPIVAGRDVGLMSVESHPVATSQPATGPTPVMPTAETMKAQQESQDARRETTRP